MHSKCESYNMEWIIKWLKFSVSLKATGGCAEEIAFVFYTWQIELQQQICIITIQRPGFPLGAG